MHPMLFSVYEMSYVSRFLKEHVGNCMLIDGSNELLFVKINKF